MKKESPYAFGCGLFITPFILVAVVWLFSPSSVAKEDVDNYISQSKNIKLTIDSTFTFVDNSWPAQVFDDENKHFVLSAPYYVDFMKRRRKYFSLIYSYSYNKYFLIENYKRDFGQLDMAQFEKKIAGMVNLKELEDKHFGTRTKPVPILWITDFGFVEPQHLGFYSNNVTDYLRFYKNRQKYNEHACAVCPY